MVWQPTGISFNTSKTKQQQPTTMQSMKNLLGACLFATILAVVFAMPKADEKYTSKYDNIDLDSILHNKRLLNNYINCLLEKGACSPDGAELKKVLPDALQHNCSKCNEKQKEGAEKTIVELSHNHEAAWKELIAKYDPTGEFRNNYAHLAKEKGVKV